MNEKIGILTENVESGYRVLKDVATTDMSENIAIKRTLDGLMIALVTQTQEFSQILASTAEGSKEVSRNISSMVQSVQFQDRVSQYISYICESLTELKSTITSFDRAFIDGMNDGKIDNYPDQQTFHRKIRTTLNLSDLQRAYDDVAVKYGFAPIC